MSRYCSRQSINAGACVCSIHPDRDATIQCMLCLKNRVPVNLSYHCSGECLKAHWPSHRNYHTRYLQQAQAQYMNGGAALRLVSRHFRCRV